MQYFYFQNSAFSVSIQMLSRKLNFISEPKFKITLYDTVRELFFLIFNNLEELVQFMININISLNSLYQRDIILPDIIYSSIPNEYGIYYNITLNYKYIEDYPSEDDDLIQFSIYSIIAWSHRSIAIRQ